MPIDFKWLISARFLFNFSARLLAVVIGWQMYELTHDALHLGFIGFAEALPALSISLYAGYFVDRSRPITVYRNVILGSLLSALIVFGCQLPGMHLTVSYQVIGLYIASFITGTARGFSQPAIYAVVPRIVPRGKISEAAAITSTTMQIASIAGPALGGMIYGWFGMSIAAATGCVGLLLAALAMMLIKAKLPAPRTRPDENLWEELLVGAKFVFGHSILLPALTLDMLSVLFGGVTALLPIFASEILHVGPHGLGLLRAAPAIGAAIVSMGVSKFDYKTRAGTWLFSSVAGFGVCILVFALSKDIVLSMVALGLSGAFDGVSMIIRVTAVQLVSPDEMRGRISSVNSIFISSSNELGEFESGVAARFLGVVPATVLGGVVCLATVAYYLVTSRDLRDLHLGKLEAEAAVRA